MMRLATVLTPVSEENLQLAAQCGVNDLVIRYPGNQPGAIAQWVQRARVHGLEVGVVEVVVGRGCRGRRGCCW